MTETSRVLVGYATATGSTREIAECIAKRLRGAGAQVDVRAAGPDLDLDGYDAFILGSAVHNMAWLEPASALVARLAQELRGRPVWCFSVAGVAPQGRIGRWLADQERARLDRALPSALRPRAHQLFSGLIATQGLPLWGRLFHLLIRDRPGDRRDWAAIEAWADDVAEALASSAAGTGSR
ncbi:flavodoxin domain-containing protein [Blastococcus sp. SYSU DS1024]